MRAVTAPFALLAASLLASCSTLDNLTADRLGTATLRSATGAPLGTVQLVGHGDAISMLVGVTGVEPGPHGIHLHSTGKCTPGDFSGAGGHLNPAQKRHGSAAPDGAHLGDLANILVADTRTGSAEYELTGLRTDLLATIFDGDGTAVVLHESADDYRTDPSGNSGKRIACGVIERAR